MKNTIIQDADCQAEYCASLKQKFKDQQEKNAKLNEGIAQNKNLDQVENKDKETQMSSD